MERRQVAVVVMLGRPLLQSLLLSRQQQRDGDMGGGALLCVGLLLVRFHLEGRAVGTEWLVVSFKKEGRRCRLLVDYI